MNNIFENAYLGKPYKTRDGKRAILLQVNNCANLAIDFETHAVTHDYKLDGTSLWSCDNLDIVSEWQEEINEEELDRMADEYVVAECDYHEGLTVYQQSLIKCAYKAGYRKAKEE